MVLNLLLVKYEVKIKVHSLTRVHVADHHNVDVGLFLSHAGYLDNQPERLSNVKVS